MKRIPVVLLALGVFLLSGVAIAQVGTNDAVLNPNLASAEEIAAVPHLGGALAEAIVEGRPYLRATDLDAMLRGAALSAAQRAEVYVTLFVPINLNTASNEEMLLVPGAGPKMAHEFDEYRPWEGGIARFRREIGKYVDDEEVARFEQYVFVPMDLNNASSEDLHTIPGVGDRMVHEFEEYRPYVSMAQFRREIGKYVDDAEVARLERFFVIEQ